jgi:hypothetical protein
MQEREILQQLKSNGVDISLFEDNGLASILSGHSLNSQGLTNEKSINLFERFRKCSGNY